MSQQMRPMSIVEVAAEAGCEVSVVLTAIAKNDLPWKFRAGHPVTTAAAMREWRDRVSA